jgi:hypothetical protein
MSQSTFSLCKNFFKIIAMQTYLQQLLNDIAAAHRTGPPEPVFPKTIKRRISLTEELFPPVA